MPENILGKAPTINQPSNNPNILGKAPTIDFKGVSEKTFNLGDVSQYDEGFLPSAFEDPTHAINNWRADNQPWYDQMADIAIRLPISLVAKTGRTLGYIGGGLSGLSEGLVDPNKDAIQTMLDGAINNDMAKFFSQANEESTLNDYAPIFQGDKYDEKNPLSKMFTTSFYATQGVDMSAFMLSTMIPAGIAAKGLTLGLKTLGGNEFAAKMAADAIWAGKAGKVLSSKKVMDGITTVTTGLLSASVESIFESNQIYDNAINAGKSKEEALALAEGSYIPNMAILSLSNTWEANQIFKGLNNTKKAVKGLLSKEGDVLAGLGTWKDLAKSGLKKAGEGVLVEGFWEENAQFAIQRWQDDVLKGSADNTVAGAFTNITKNLFTNLGKEEGWENILGGALMGVVMGGIGGVKQRKGETQLAQQYSKNFKEGYKLEDFRKNIEGLRDTYSKQKEAGKEVEGMQELIKNSGELLAKMYNLNLGEAGSKLQDYLAMLNQDDLFNYMQDQLIAGLVHNYTTNGMSDHLITKIDALKNPSEVDRLVFNRVGDTKEDIDTHLNNVKTQVQEYEKKCNQVEDNFGWQTVTEKDDKGVDTKIPLYNTKAIYTLATQADSQRKHISALRLKNIALENKLIADELADNPTSVRNIEDIAKEKLNSGGLEAKELKKNKAQIETLSKLMEKTQENFEKLTNPKTARSHIKQLIAEQTYETEALVKDPEKNLTEFEKGVNRLEELNATGKLFYNGKAGNFHRSQTEEIWFNPDDKSQGTQITEENYEEFLSQAKTKEQLDIDQVEELEKNKQKAKIEAIEKLINYEGENLTKMKNQLKDADNDILDKLMLIEAELEKKGSLRKNATKKKAAIDKVVADIQSEIDTLTAIKSEIENSIQVLENSIEILNQELQQTKDKYTSFDDQFQEYVDLAEKIASKNLPEAEALMEDSKSLLTDIQNKILTLTERFNNFKDKYDQLLKTNEAAKLIYKVYNKQFKNKYKGVFRLLNRNVLEDIIENGIKPTYDNFQEFKDINELRDFIYNNPGFLTQFTQILRNQKELDENVNQLDFLKNQMVVTQKQMDELLPTLKELTKIYEEYVKDKELWGRIDSFINNYDRLSKKFNQVFKRLNDETIAKYKSYIGVTEQPVDNIQIEQEPSDKPPVANQYNGAKKDTAYSTANKSEDNPLIDKIIANLPFENGKYFFKLISTLKAENFKYLTPQERDFDLNAVKNLKAGETYYPLKALLVDANGSEVLADENGNIGKGKPVVFNLNRASYVDQNRLNAKEIVLDFLQSKGIAVTGEEFDQFKKPIWNKNTKQDLIDIVFSIIRNEVAKFRQDAAMADYHGTPVFVPVISKSNGIPVKLEVKPLVGAFVSNIADISLIDIAISKKGDNERFNYVEYRLPDGSTKRVMSGIPLIVNKDGNVISSQNKTLDNNEVNLVIDLLDKALNTSDTTKIQLEGTNGKKYYILPNKSTKGESLIERLLLWNSSVLSNPMYHISFSGGKIYYGWDSTNKQYYSIDAINLKQQANIEHFKQFLRNKYYNVNKTFLNRDIFEQPTGITEDGRVEIITHDKRINDKVGAYEHFLVTSGKLQTTLPKLGEVQYKGMYLQYNPKPQNTIKKEEPKVVQNSVPEKVSEKNPIFVPSQSEPDPYEDYADDLANQSLVSGTGFNLIEMIQQANKKEGQVETPTEPSVENIVMSSAPITLEGVNVNLYSEQHIDSEDISEEELLAQSGINTIPTNEDVKHVDKNCLPK